MPNPFHDHAEPILRSAPITDAQRASLWDTFHAAKDHYDLGQRLQHSDWADVPTNVKEQLYDAKKESVAPPSDPVDKAIAALNRIAEVENIDAAENKIG